MIVNVEGISNGVCGKDLTWVLDSGTLTINGTGKMDDFTLSGTSFPTWYDNKNDITSVVIEYGVTSIGSNAFNGCDNLVSVVIPEDMGIIGTGSFASCSSLEYVFFQGSVQPTCSNTFGGSVKNMCTSPKYHLATFCGASVTDSDFCETFQRKFTSCSEGSFLNNQIVVQRRKIAKVWEDYSDDCINFFCDDLEGLLWKGKCSNFSDDTVMCSKGKCVERIEDKKWSVEIEFDYFVPIYDVYIVLLKDTAVLTGVSVDEMTIKMEYNSYGFVSRIAFFVEDEETANTLIRDIDKCGHMKRDASSDSSDNDLCDGIFTHLKSAKVVNVGGTDSSKGEGEGLSTGALVGIIIGCICAVAVVVVAIIAVWSVIKHKKVNGGDINKPQKESKKSSQYDSPEQWETQAPSDGDVQMIQVNL